MVSGVVTVQLRTIGEILPTLVLVPFIVIIIPKNSPRMIIARLNLFTKVPVKNISVNRLFFLVSACLYVRSVALDNKRALFDKGEPPSFE